jgi:hypothetical protein
VWFSCPFVPSEHGAKVIAVLEVCTATSNMQLCVFFVSEGMKGAEIHRKLAEKYRQYCLPQ